jgi:histidine ammonia-lyase
MTSPEPQYSQLSLQDVVNIARYRHSAPALTDEVRERVQASRDVLTAATADSSQPVYGINTGFGALSGSAVFENPHDARVLMRNLITSHSVGTGPHFEEEVVRAAMLIRANSLARGYSGVRPLIIDRLIAMLNAGVYPAVPSLGSLGASGDLAPLAHLALMMSQSPPIPEESDDPRYRTDTDTGEAFIPIEAGEALPAEALHLSADRASGKQRAWKRVTGREAMTAVGGSLELESKEGLALNNGATFSAALAALTLHDALALLDHAEVALALSLEAMRGFRDPFLPQVHQARPHQGAGITARHVMAYLDGSELPHGGPEHRPERIPPQDPYSLRCAPQVLGAVRDTLAFVRTTIETEINAATDNPLIFSELARGYPFVSSGNFHGEPLAMGMDFLGIAVTELGNIAERRVFKMTEYRVADRTFAEIDSLPPFLIDRGGPVPGLSSGKPGPAEAGDPLPSGLQSGLMIAQYTAASLVSKCKTLAHPDSVDSIPSSANQEDHVSMSLNAALHAREIVDHIEAVIAIEFLFAAQALTYRERQAEADRAAGERQMPLQMGQGTDPAYRRIREIIPPLGYDRALYPDLRAMIGLMRSGELVRQARRGAGISEGDTPA